jgi:VIT1/CCC1 family predicted Fe2+/Mn2+ transporter
MPLLREPVDPNSPAARPTSLERWRSNLQGESDGIAIYRAMAAAERDASLAEVYAKLADAEARHAAVWQEKLREANARPELPRPSWRARLLVLITGRFGADIVAPTVAAREARDRFAYDAQPDAAASLPRDERSHARLLREISTNGLAGPSIARLEGRHRTSGGNALRAAVLGIDDGLVSNFSLISGVAGAGGDAHAIVIAGIAGMLAGSLSMALGEWLSVQSARELYSRQIEIESEELAAAPEEEEEELALIYHAKGAAPDQARVIARDIVRGGRALDTLAREELAIDPSELGGSAYVAAGTSFAMFASGAIVPLLPFLFMSGTPAIVGAAALSAAALFGVGAAITVITGQPALRAGVRQLVIGVAAAAITFGIGRLLGTAIS